MQGVYAIINKIDGRKYVGSSQDIEKRFVQHKLALRAGTHCNKGLCEAYEKHGMDAFELVVLKEMEPGDKRHIDRDLRLAAEYQATNEQQAWAWEHGYNTSNRGAYHNQEWTVARFNGTSKMKTWMEGLSAHLKVRSSSVLREALKDYAGKVGYDEMPAEN